MCGGDIVRYLGHLTLYFWCGGRSHAVDSNISDVNYNILLRDCDFKDIVVITIYSAITNEQGAANDEQVAYTRTDVSSAEPHIKSLQDLKTAIC